MPRQQPSTLSSHRLTVQTTPLPSPRPLQLQAIALLILLSISAMSPVSAILVYSFEEEMPIGTVLGNLRHDSNLSEFSPAVRDSLTFQFMPSRIENPFIIDSKSGVITNHLIVDREKICSRSVHNFMGPVDCHFTFNIALKPVIHIRIIVIMIQIRDVNDQWPRFPEYLVTHQLSESTTVGSGFSLPQAIDLDSPAFSVVDYTIEYDDPADSQTFQLKVNTPNNNRGSKTIRIVTLRELDYESKNFYTFRVKCLDGGNPPRVGTLDISINILDANDHIPKFDNSTYKIRVAENFPVDDKLLTVHAVDKDSGKLGTVVYSLGRRTLDRHGGLFTINEQSGALYLGKPLDFETSHIYHLSVVARDLGENHQSSEATVVIHVTDINDETPTITVNTPESRDTSSASVPEASVPGRFVAHVRVLDPDSGRRGQFNCSLKPDQTAFSLEKLYAKEYQILTTRTLDREIQHTYLLTIECQDHGSPSKRSSKTLSVEVIDVNDHPPKFKHKIYKAQIYENNYIGAYVITVNATDLDTGTNARLEYSLLPVNGSGAVLDFVIDSHSGRVTAARLFDRETTPLIRVLVVAKDNGNKPMNSSVLLIVKVVDVDDNPPLFLDSAYSFGMYENEPIGTQVGIVTARDIDAPANADFDYFIQPHKMPNSARFKHNEDFSLDTRTGKLVSKRLLDRESYTVFHFVVIAESKSGSPKKKGSATVSVYLADRNDNPPQILYPSRRNNTISISSMTPAGYIISKVKAYDPDAANNAKLTYSLVPKMPHSRKIVFAIDPKLGLISLNIDVSTISFKTYALQLQVTDSGVPHLSTMRNFFINVNASIAKPPLQTTLITRKPKDLSFDGGSIRRNVIVVAALACISILVMLTLVVVIAVVRRQEHQRKRRKSRLQALKMLTARDAGCCEVKSDPAECSANGLTSSSEGSTNIADLSDLPPPPPPNHQYGRTTNSTQRSNGKREVSFQDDIPDEEPLSRSWFTDQQAQISIRHTIQSKCTRTLPRVKYPSIGREPVTSNGGCTLPHCPASRTEIHKLLALLRQQDAGADVTADSLYTAYYYDKTKPCYLSTPPLAHLDHADTDSGRGSGQLTEGWSNKDVWRGDITLKVIDKPSNAASLGVYLSNNANSTPNLVTRPRPDVSDTSNQIVPDVSNISYASDSTACQFPNSGTEGPAGYPYGNDRHHSTANEFTDMSIRKPDLTFGTTPMRRGPRDRDLKKAMLYSCADISEEEAGVTCEDSDDLAAVKRRALATPPMITTVKDPETPADISDLYDSSFCCAASTYYTAEPTQQDQTIDPRELVRDIDRMFFDSHV